MEVNRIESAAQLVAVPDATAVGTARRMAIAAAERAGHAEPVVGRVALVATELATNLARHGGGGSLIVQESRADRALELLAVDRGPGIASLAEALRDGFSTGGTGGTGLGAVHRVADEADVLSAPGSGTIVLARFGGSPAASTPGIRIGGLSLPHVGESVCGDAWASQQTGDRVAVLVADGLGHGVAAATAAEAAAAVFHERPGATPADLLAEAHAALRHTRGAALAMVVIQQGILLYAGVGNIAGTVIRDGESRSLVSHAGIVGHQCHKIQEFTLPWAPGTLLVLHSDGLQSRWQLPPVGALRARHPTLVSAALYRDFARGRDDVTVVTVVEQ